MAHDITMFVLEIFSHYEMQNLKILLKSKFATHILPIVLHENATCSFDTFCSKIFKLQ